MSEPTPPAVPAEPAEPFDPFAPQPAADVVHGPVPMRRRTALWVTLGVVIGVLLGAAVGVTVTGAYDHRNDIATAIRPPTLTSGSISVDDLMPGDCFDEQDSSDAYVGDLTSRPCTGPHGAQAFSIFTYEDSGTYPGDDEIDSFAGTRCTRDFKANKALSSAASSDQLNWYTPSADSWSGGDRKGVCLVTGPPAQLIAPFPVVR